MSNLLEIIIDFSGNNFKKIVKGVPERGKCENIYLLDLHQDIFLISFTCLMHMLYRLPIKQIEFTKYFLPNTIMVEVRFIVIKDEVFCELKGNNSNLDWYERYLVIKMDDKFSQQLIATLKPKNK
jgi:hypothetical protein